MFYILYFIYYFKREFPLKAIYVKDQDINKWIAQDLKISRKRLRFWNTGSSKRITNLSRESLDYIGRYHITYNRLKKEERERERDLFEG